MKVICVENYYGLLFLTIGKEYEVLIHTDRAIKIWDDSINASWYCSDFFITKKEYRNKKLEELGI